ncbi:MAG: hypothetical protein KIT28_06835, partial [Rubrivivax sp.]|nr:hypothetical protein [Rubrivivax sp.]
PDNPLFDLIAKARATESPVSDYDLALESPRLAKAGIAVHAALMPDDPGHLVLALIDASTAQKLDRQLALRNAGRSVEGMAAILAHEVKNPLSGIRGAAQLLEAGLSAQDRELTQLICDEVDRIRALVERMEQFGGRPAAFAPVNINQVLDHVKRLAEKGFARNVRFAEVYDPSLPAVWGNRDQLVQVLLNLVKNAAEAIDNANLPPKRRNIELRVVPRHTPEEGGVIEFTVTDAGPGLKEEVIARMYEAFFSTKTDGLGIGLSLCRSIVESHHGRIKAQNLYNAESVVGCRFSFTLPVDISRSDAHPTTHPTAVS